MKQAILIVSFGTTHLDTLERSISTLEAHIGAAFPNLPRFRAFTSPRIRARLAQRHGLEIPSPAEAMEQLIREGYESVLVQPPLLIPGEEFDKLRRTLLGFRDRISLKMGLPLLWREDDLDGILHEVAAFYHPAQEEILLLMGHGTEHDANRFYTVLDEKMRSCPDCCMRICTVEGKPDIADAVAALREQPIRRIVAAPLMLVAGDHAKNDMAGDEPDSLRSMLEQAGFSVECRFVGLGEIPAIRDRYLRRLREAAAL